MTHLVRMFTEQRRLQEELGVDIIGMNDQARIEYLKTMYIGAVNELGEAINEVPWKTWSSKRDANLPAFLSELNDAFQFIMNMLIAAFPESSPEQLAEAFTSTHATKIAINRRRIRDGYDGSSKCPKCRRAFDDVAVACVPGDCVVHPSSTHGT